MRMLTDPTKQLVAQAAANPSGSYSVAAITALLVEFFESHMERDAEEMERLRSKVKDLECDVIVRDALETMRRDTGKTRVFDHGVDLAEKGGGYTVMTPVETWIEPLIDPGPEEVSQSSEGIGFPGPNVTPDCRTTGPCVLVEPPQPVSVPDELPAIEAGNPDQDALARSNARKLMYDGYTVQEACDIAGVARNKRGPMGAVSQRLDQALARYSPPSILSAILAHREGLPDSEIGRRLEPMERDQIRLNAILPFVAHHSFAIGAIESPMKVHDYKEALLKRLTEKYGAKVGRKGGR